MTPILAEASEIAPSTVVLYVGGAILATFLYKLADQAYDRIVGKKGKDDSLAEARLDALEKNTEAVLSLKDAFSDHKEIFAGHKAVVDTRLDSMDREIRDLKNGSGCSHPTIGKPGRG
jgi:hypothetical protein